GGKFQNFSFGEENLTKLLRLLLGPPGWPVAPSAAAAAMQPSSPVNDQPILSGPYGRRSVRNRTSGRVRRGAHLLSLALRAAARARLHLRSGGRTAGRGAHRQGARSQPDL